MTTQVFLKDLFSSTVSGYWGSGAAASEVDVKIVRNGDIARDGSVRWDELPVRGLSEAEAKKASISDDDLLMTTSGECGRVALVRSDPVGVCTSNFVRRIRCDTTRTDPGFAYHLLRDRTIQREFARFTRGTTLQNLSLQKAFSSISVSLPPLGEQRRIASILDAADELRTKRQQAIDQLDTLTEAIFHEMFGDPLSPDPSLEMTNLADVATFVRGITFKPTDVLDSPGPRSVGVMRTANVQSELDTKDVWELPDSFVKRDDQYLRPFDTLISSANSWNLVGRCCLIPKEIQRSSFGGFVTALRPTGSKIRPRFLHSWFSSSKVQQTVRTFGRRTTNISNLDLKRCAGLRIAVPELASQVEFENRLDGVDGLLAGHKHGLGQIDDLFASLQQRAFRGDL
jgi:type I restriction enzyme, S subunit